MAKHTPGPWEAKEITQEEVTKQTLKYKTPYDITHDGGLRLGILYLSTSYLPQTIANAKLIAAAPDLLEVCQLFASGPHSPVADCPADIAEAPCICGLHDAQRKARKAIAKATEGGDDGTDAS